MRRKFRGSKKSTFSLKDVKHYDIDTDSDIVYNDKVYLQYLDLSYPEYIFKYLLPVVIKCKQILSNDSKNKDHDENHDASGLEIFVDAFINNFTKFSKFVSRNEEYHRTMKKFKWVFSHDIDNTVLKLPPLLLDDLNK